MALYDHQDNLITTARGSGSKDRIRQKLVPNEYRIRVFTEGEQAGDYQLTLRGKQISLDGNDTWSESHILENISRDELSPYSSGLLDIMDFYTFTLDEDSWFVSHFETSTYDPDYEIRLYDENKNLYPTEYFSASGDYLSGSLYAGTYYVVVDASEADSFSPYDLFFSKESVMTDEGSSFSNPMQLDSDGKVRDSLNINQDREDIIEIDVVGTAKLVLI